MDNSSEVKVVARLDTSDLEGPGVQRAKGAANNLRRMLEENMGNYQFPSPKADPNPLQQGEWSVFGKTQAQPGGGGQSMIGGILSGFLIRDAIREVIRGFGEAMKEAQAQLEKFTGAVGPTLSIWKAAGDIIAGTVIGAYSPLQRAGLNHLEDQEREINARDQERKDLLRYKQHPELLNATAASLTSQLGESFDAERDLKIKDAQDSFLSASGAGSAGEEANNANRMKEILERRKVLQEELHIVEERDRKDKERQKREAELADKLNRENIENSDRMARAAREEDARKAKDAAEAQKIQDAVEKRATREGNEETIAGDEVSRRAGEGDLKEIKRNLDHQRATSAVTINGGLFGRSDSAALLAQRAAEQVNYLRSIDKNIQDLRNANRELTLE